MNQLIEFLRRIRLLLLFLVLEGIALFLVFNQNTYQRVAFLHTANAVTGSVFNVRQSITGYFSLGKENQELRAENAHLRRMNNLLRDKKEHFDLKDRDLRLAQHYRYLPAKVLQNTHTFAHNYLTINKGSSDGLAVGMGVISSQGVVGKVTQVSGHYAMVTTLLHKNFRLAARLKRLGTIGSLRWNSGDIRHAQLEFIPKHVRVLPGDRVETAESTIFPDGIPCGKVADVEYDKKLDQLNINVRLAVDFTAIQYVYALEKPLKAEKDSLEQNIEDYERKPLP